MTGCRATTGGPPLSYWPSVPCPDHNTKDSYDVCLIRHRYQTAEYDTNMKAYSSAVTADGRWAAFGGSSQEPVLLVNLNDGVVTELEGSFSDTAGVAFSPDGTLLAATAARKEQEAVIRLWDVRTHKLVRELRAPTLPEIWYGSVSFTPDGKWVLAGRGYGDVIIWEAATGAVVKVLAAPRQQQGSGKLSISPDGTRLVVAPESSGRYVTVYDLITGKVLAELNVSQLNQQDGYPQDVAFSPDGQWVAVAASCHDPKCQGMVWLWNPTKGTVNGLRGHVGDAASVVFHPDGRWLASGGVDNTIRIWDWRKGTEIYRMEAPAAHEILTGTPAPGVPKGVGGLGSTTQGLWAPVDTMSITTNGSTIVYSEPANGQVRVWRLPEHLWR